MPPRFPLLRLPYLPRKTVVKHLKPMQILLFCLSSERCRSLVHECSVRVVNLTLALSYVIKISLTFPIRSSSASSSNDSTIEVILEPVVPEEWKRRKQSGRFSHAPIEQMEALIRKESEKSVKLMFCQHISESKERMCQQAMNYFYRNFRIEEGFLNVWRERVNSFPISPFAERNHRRLKRVQYRSLRLTPSIEPDEYHLFQLLPVEKFEVDCRMPSEYRIQTPLHHRNMSILNATWLTFGSMLRMDCVTFTAEDVPFRSIEVHRFVIAWYQGSFANLESLTLHKAGGIFDSEVILRELPVARWHGVSRPRYHGEIDCAEGRDLRRSKDGRLASVICNESTFTLVVWHPKHLTTSHRPHPNPALQMQ